MRLSFQRKPSMGTRSDAGSSLNQKHLVSPSLAPPPPFPGHAPPSLATPPLPSPSPPVYKAVAKPRGPLPLSLVPGQSRYAPTNSYCPLCTPSVPSEPVNSTFITHLSRPLNMRTSCSVHDWAPTSLILGRTPAESLEVVVGKGNFRVFKPGGGQF